MTMYLVLCQGFGILSLRAEGPHAQICRDTDWGYMCIYIYIEIYLIYLYQMHMHCSCSHRGSKIAKIEDRLPLIIRRNTFT